MSGFSFDVEAFEDDLDEPVRSTKSIVTPSGGTISTTVARVTSSVSARTEHRRDFLTRPVDRWDWNDLRNYVVSKIEERDTALGIPLPSRQEQKEFGIFSAFWGRHEGWAGQIAIFAFETQSQPGYWKNAPISITRFCVKSDPYFALPILEKIRQV